MNIFIDTNVFLSFYHLSNDDLEELKKLIVLIDNKEVTLWLPNQVKDEFYRNRENKIADALKKLKEQQQKRQFPQICKDYPEYTEITALLKQYDKNLSTLIKNVTDDINAKNLKADTVISQLFSKATRIKRTPAIIDKAKTRMSIGNPPGKDDSIGDAINWLLLLDSVPDDEDLYLIADDRDYYSILGKVRISGEILLG